MKNTGVCPKCQSTEIVRIPGIYGAHGSGNNIQVGLTTFSAVMVTRFVCTCCGFLEDWVERQGDLDMLKKKFGQE